MGRSITIQIAMLAGLCLAVAVPIQAQEKSSNEILLKLKPKKGIKRGLSRTGPSADEVEFIRRLPARGIRKQEREQLTKIIVKQELPKIDVQIQFELDSARISPEASRQIDALGAALSDQSMGDSRIAISGHTDASGTDEHNLELSEERAASVRRALIADYGINPERLVAIGFGEERLEDTYDPENPINRRVEIVRLTQ